MGTTVILILVTVIHRVMPALVQRFSSVVDVNEISRNYRSVIIKILALFMTIFYPGTTCDVNFVGVYRILC
jgi:hypothetical protein